MSLGGILYWILFAALCIGWVAWVYVTLFGVSGPLGYTRSSVEDTPTDKNGNH